MVVTTDPVRAQWAARLRLGVLALVSLLIAHTAIYAAQYGLGDRFAGAMSGAGHDGWWLPASLAILGVGLVALLHVLGVLSRLESVARDVPEERLRPGDAAGPRFAPEVLTIWRRLFLVVAVLFAVQENLEHLVMQGHLPGVDVLGGAEYPLALPILAAVTLTLAALGALVRWRIATLRALVSRATRPIREPIVADVAARRWRIVGELAPRRWMVARLDAGRAPPSPLRPW